MPDYDKIRSEDRKGDKYIPPNCKISCSEVGLFEETADILLFDNKNYKFSISVGPMSNKIPPR